MKEAYERQRAKQRERYATDPIYREKVKAQNKERMRQIYADPEMHMLYCARRREYMRNYMRTYYKKRNARRDTGCGGIGKAADLDFS